MLATAGALDWSRSLPDGLDTVVGVGGRWLSQFEAQRLALARSHLTAARVLVLDEATAEAGSSGTRDLDRAIERMRAGRTTLIVAHRLGWAGHRAVAGLAGRTGGGEPGNGTRHHLTAPGTTGPDRSRERSDRGVQPRACATARRRPATSKRPSYSRPLMKTVGVPCTPVPTASAKSASTLSP